VVTETGVRRRRTHVLENTVLSFVTAASVGAEYVEFDVHVTRDGVPIVHHDYCVTIVPESSGHGDSEEETAVMPSIRVPVSLLSADDLSDLMPAAHFRAGTVVDSIAALSRALPPVGPLGPPRPPAAPSSSSAAAVAARRREGSRPLQALGLDSSKHATRSRLFEGLKDRYTTLVNVFRRVDPTCGFNIEVKFPLAAEERLLGFTAPERNALVDSILDVVFENVGQRPVYFSSFDPDICLLLVRKQSVYPVFLLTAAGTEPTADPRRASLRAAVGFAKSSGLLGVVSDVGPLLAAPRLIDAVLGNGLVLATYGRRNNDVDAVRLQRAMGVSFVILDHVAHVTRALRTS
jgi:glycerophosphodiester phosphodiesterase